MLNPSSNQVFQYDWQHDDEVLAAETLTHNRGGNSICWGPDRQLWIAGPEAGTSDATLTAYNSDGTPTGIDLTFPGQTILLTENSAAMPAVAAFPDDDFETSTSRSPARTRLIHRTIRPMKFPTTCRRWTVSPA